MHLAPLIHDLAIILGVAGLVTLLFQKIRQPVVLGYIIAGIIVGPHTPPTPLVSDIPSIQIWAELGVIFLMFSLGLEFSFRKLTSVGVSAGITAIVEIAFMIFIGGVTGKFLGWSTIDSVFLGAMLSISSTTIIIKALDELKLKTRRFAEMIFGILIVEDLVAILLLVGLSTFAVAGSFSGLTVLKAGGKLLLVMGSWFIAGYFVVPRYVRFVGRVGSNEMLTIISVSLCLALVVFAAHFDYSVALGAFIMGSILAETTESHRIEERIEPLKDLFAAVFFVSVGMLIDPKLLWQNFGAVIVISIVTILGKVLTTTMGALVTGQTLRTSIQVGFGLAQIGEFSFIIATLGLTLGVTSQFLYPIGVAVSIITTFSTPYMIRHSHRFAVALEAKLPVRVKSALVKYSAWTQSRRANAARKREFYQLLFRWILNGFVVSTLFILAGEIGIPWMSKWIENRRISVGVAWLTALVLAAPFVWAMLNTFRNFQLAEKASTLDHPPRGGTLFLMRLLSLIWIGILSIEFFTIQYVIIIILVLAGGFTIVFYRQLEMSYQWFEKRFLSTFEVTEKTQAPGDLLKHLAPWDAHLIRIKVHPNAPIVLKKLSDVQLRSRHGVNVVAIQRGMHTIVAPKPNELILPKDELLVLGTDEQVDHVRPGIEKPPGLSERFSHLVGYELRKVLLLPHSQLIGATIRTSGFRENFDIMVVGIERGDQRMINPESDVKLEMNDILWCVGEKAQLDRLELSLSDKTLKS